ncbi:hypothetical protein LCGC14_0466890 [marine sediment metagenome]|uniref:Uncharacterized protein n=1 Tax=marine sediment metagenome TaxID=412755 RepID=A0A0F9SIN2_9ZZZZ
MLPGEAPFWARGIYGEGQGQANVGMSGSAGQRAMTQEEMLELILQMRRGAILFSKHPSMPGFTEAEKKELRKPMPTP